MFENNISEQCPIWNKPCLKSACVSYEVHSKQRFKNKKTDRFIPLEQLEFYTGLSEEQKKETIERYVTVVHECKHFAKIIQIESVIDNLIPLEKI